MKALSQPLRYFILLAYFCLVAFAASATNVSGTIKDPKGEVIPFVSIMVEGTTKGTLGNAEGFFSIDLAPGNYVLVFRTMGYKAKREQVALGATPVKIKVTMEADGIMLREIEVSNKYEDPAMEIMRKAISNRKKHLTEVESFQCKAYLKGLNKIDSAPKKILGQELKIDLADSNNAAVVYFSESVSEYYFKQPKKEKEIIIASKVSGKPNGFSFNRYTEINVNFYENMIENLPSERGAVSPLSQTAMIYYKYKLLKSFEEGGTTIHKIELQPKRRFDPCFRGIIYIQEGSFRLHGADVYLTGEAGQEFVDTLRFVQTMVPVANDIWMPATTAVSFKFNIFKIRGQGYFLAFVSDYNLKPDLAPDFFNAQVVKVEERIKSNDTTFWNATRVVPLTEMEKTDYRRKDSLYLVKQSPQYKDSIDKKNNKFKFWDVFGSYDHQNSFKHTRWSVGSPLSPANFAFNTVEGFNTGSSIRWTKRDSGGVFERHTFMADARYAFYLKRAYGSASYRYVFDIKRFKYVNFEAGNEATQFNGNKPIGVFMNTSFTLLDETNYMKLYEKAWFKAEYGEEFIRGIRSFAGLEYARRSRLDNNPKAYVLRDVKDRVYSTNNPFAMNDASMGNNTALIYTVGSRFTFKNKYTETKDFILYEENNYPVLTTVFTGAFAGDANSQVQWHLFRAQVTHNISLKLLGKIEYAVSGGLWLDNSKVPFVDRRHFNGNQIFMMPRGINRFFLLPYYSNSTAENWAEGHAEWQGGGFLFNKIPLIKRLKLYEAVGVHHLSTGSFNYTEFSAGIDNIFKILRVDYARALNKTPGGLHAVRLRIDL